MAYKKTNWQDTLRDAQGNVIQKGTPLNAQALGKIEDGIVQAEQKIDNEISRVAQQLAQKANETDVRKAGIPITERDISDTLKQQITGNAPISQVLMDKAVTPLKTTFFERSKNLFDSNARTVGYSVNETTGNLYASTPVSASDFIMVEPETTYFHTYDGKRAYYNENKVYISGVQPTTVTGKSFTTPAGAFYVRVTVANSVINTYQLEKGSVGTYYVPYRDYIPLSRIAGEVKNEELAESTITPNKTTFFRQGKNLFNKSAVEFRSIADASKGTLNPSSTTYALSEYITVDPNTSYTRNYKHGLLFYDKDKYFISGVIDSTNDTFVTPNHTKFVRVSVLQTLLDSYQLEKGSVLTEYEPYKVFIPNDYLEVSNEGTAPVQTKTVPLFTNMATDGTTSVVDIENNAAVKINVDKLVRGRFFIQVSNDQVNWQTIPLKNQITETVSNNIYSVGTYVADVAGWKYLKGTGVLLIYPGAIINADVTLMQTNPAFYKYNILQRSGKSPAFPTQNVTVKADASNAYYKAGRNAGELYSIIGTQVRKSVNYGESFNMLNNFGTGLTARAVEVLKDGTLLVATQGGKVWKSETDERTFREVLQLVTPNANVSSNFGLHSWDNIIVLSEYGSASPPNNARRAYLSTDYGATFTEIFEGLNTGTYHVHDVCYDPYSKIIWITCGDGEASSNVYYSMDMGKTFIQVYKYGECPNQFTSMIALPNCMLFVTDNKNTGVWRWDRLTSPVTSETKILIEHAYEIYNEYPGSEPIGNRAGVVYGENAVAYFGFSYFANNVFMNSKIWGTANGYDFYELWDSGKLSYSATGTSGVMSISDPDVNGDVYATLYDSGYYMVKIENPNWS